MKMRFYALWLSLVCIIVFVLQLVMPGLTGWFVLSQNFPFEIWRFVSAIFLHGSLSHLILNLFALALFGTILEHYIGSKRFLLVFFASGIIANIVAIWFYPSSLGASGAIYGILGALVILRPLMVVWVYGLPMPMFIAGIVWIIGDMIGVFVPSGVGNIAHLSGIAIGFIFGFLWRDWKKEEKKERIVFDERAVREWEDRHVR